MCKLYETNNLESWDWLWNWFHRLWSTHLLILISYQADNITYRKQFLWDYVVMLCTMFFLVNWTPMPTWAFWTIGFFLRSGYLMEWTNITSNECKTLPCSTQSSDRIFIRTFMGFTLTDQGTTAKIYCWACDVLAAEMNSNTYSCISKACWKYDRKGSYCNCSAPPLLAGVVL